MSIYLVPALTPLLLLGWVAALLISPTALLVKCGNRQRIRLMRIFGVGAALLFAAVSESVGLFGLLTDKHYSATPAEGAGVWVLLPPALGAVLALYTALQERRKAKTAALRDPNHP